jgi:hypothetical protein
MRIEASREELTALIDAIKHLWEGDPIQTRHIAFHYCLNLGIRQPDKCKELFTGDFWTQFFGWRKMHYKLTLMLDALRELEFIEYEGGKTKLLNKRISIQEIL